MSSTLDRAITKFRRDGFKETFKAGMRTYTDNRILSYLPVILYLDEPDYEYIDEVKLYHDQFWIDRYVELKRFYGKPHTEFISNYLKNGVPNSRYYKSYGMNLEKEYFGGPDTSPPPDELLTGYRSIHFYVSNRQMLGYHAYDIANEYVKIVDDVSDVSMLDYGCGVADPAVYLGTQGVDTTIVDLDTKWFDFASHRLESRGVDHESIRAKQTESPVDIPRDHFDFVVMSEFLEHVRNPLRFLQVAVDKLPRGGILYDSMGREYTHTVSTQHLKEAKEVIESEEYRELHQDSFEHIDGHFWRRV